MARFRNIAFVSLLLIISMGFINCCYSDNTTTTPEMALNMFIRAVQEKGGLSLFSLDGAAPQTTGLFKDEIQDKKTKYASSVFADNPSQCPGGTGNKSVPCEGSTHSSSVRSIQLLIPKGSQYVIAEKVFSDPPKNTSVRMLVKVTYPREDSPIFISELKAIQIYTGGIIPTLPPLGDTGIVQRDNSLLSVTKTNDQWKFPITFNARAIKEATIEAQLYKDNDSWKVRAIQWKPERLQFSENLRVSGGSVAGGNASGTTAEQKDPAAQNKEKRNVVAEATPGFEDQLIGKWGDSSSSIEFLKNGDFILHEKGEESSTDSYKVLRPNVVSFSFRKYHGVCQCTITIERDVITFSKSKDCPWARQAPRLQ